MYFESYTFYRHHRIVRDRHAASADICELELRVKRDSEQREETSTRSSFDEEYCAGIQDLSSLSLYRRGNV